jgi:hypothetical protein
MPSEEVQVESLAEDEEEMHEEAVVGSESEEELQIGVGSRFLEEDTYEEEILTYKTTVDNRDATSYYHSSCSR